MQPIGAETIKIAENNCFFLICPVVCKVDQIKKHFRNPIHTTESTDGDHVAQFNALKCAEDNEGELDFHLHRDSQKMKVPANCKQIDEKDIFRKTIHCLVLDDAFADPAKPKIEPTGSDKLLESLPMVKGDAGKDHSNNRRV